MSIFIHIHFYNWIFTYNFGVASLYLQQKKIVKEAQLMAKTSIHSFQGTLLV